MNEDRLIEYLDHMLEAGQLACSYVEGMSKENFLADKRTQQAVILNMIVLGEVATRLLKDRPTFPDQYPDVPWKSMKGMRNRIAHGYFDIDLDIVWDTVHANVPPLVTQLARIKQTVIAQ